MARSSWWNKPISIKNDLADPSNMTKGEVTTMGFGTLSLIIFMITLDVLSPNVNQIVNNIILLAAALLLLLVNLYMYIRFAIRPHKDNKLYVAGCITLLITAWVSIVFASLYGCGFRVDWDIWEDFGLVYLACLLVNAIIGIIALVKITKQAKQEGKPSLDLLWYIHLGWFFMPVAASLMTT